MIKCVIDKKKDVISVQAAGSVEQLTTELLVLIRAMHHNIKENNSDLADAFRRRLIGAVIDPDPDSPVWKEI